MASGNGGLLGSNPTRREGWGLSAGSFKALLLTGDITAFFAAVGLLAWVTGAWPLAALGMVALGSTQLVGLYLVESYEERVYREAAGLPTRVLVAVGLAGVLAGGVALLLPQAGLTRGLGVGYALFAIPVFLAWRWGGAHLVRGHLRPRRIAVVGGGAAARELVEAFAENPQYDLAVVVANRDDEFFAAAQNVPVVHEPMADLPQFLVDNDVDLVAVALPEDDRKALYRELVRCRYMGIEVQDMADCFELLRHRLPVRYLDDGWVAFSSRFMGWGHDFEQKAKRMIDFLIALVGVTLTGPLMLVIAAAVRLTSPGPALFQQARVGRGGKVYTLFKFRSMRVDAEANGAVWAQEKDPRATALGSFLRKSHLDELPQFFNVLRGDMSLVGPRPERPEFVAELREQIPYYDLRHIVRPGVTGWAQISYPYGASVEDAQAKLEYDLYYIRHKDLLWDLRIILRTVTVSLLGRGSR